MAYYRARALGGVGLITVEMAAPEKVGRHRARELGIYDDRFIGGLARLVDDIHAHGARAAIQLGHGGGYFSSAMRWPPERRSKQWVAHSARRFCPPAN